MKPFGLDEAWLAITSAENQKDKGERMAQEIQKEFGITVSIGVSCNKIFAKLGSDYRKPDTVTLITRENYRQIAWLPLVSDLLYVGSAPNLRLTGFWISAGRRALIRAARGSGIPAGSEAVKSIYGWRKPGGFYKPPGLKQNVSQKIELHITIYKGGLSDYHQERPPL